MIIVDNTITNRIEFQLSKNNFDGCHSTKIKYAYFLFGHCSVCLSVCLGITGSDYPIGILIFVCLQSEKHGNCLKETGQQPKKQQQKTHKNTQKTQNTTQKTSD